MHRFATLVASAPNPGPYNPPDGPPTPRFDFFDEWGGDPAWACVWVAVIVGLFALMAIVVRESELVGLALGFVAFAFAAAAALFGMAHQSDVHEAEAKAEKAFERKVAAYDQRYVDTFKRWFGVDYGITLDTDAVFTLVDGHQLVATTHDGQRMLELADTTDHLLAVRVVGGQILQPAE